MDERQLKQLFAELVEANGQAIGLLTTALARQLDAARLTENLRSTIQAAEALKAAPSLAIRLANHALAAAEAESALQNPAKH